MSTLYNSLSKLTPVFSPLILLNSDPKPDFVQTQQYPLYCTVLYCTLLYFTILYYTLLYFTLLYCTVLYCTVLYCTILYCAVLIYTTQWEWEVVSLSIGDHLFTITISILIRLINQASVTHDLNFSISLIPVPIGNFMTTLDVGNLYLF